MCSSKLLAGMATAVAMFPAMAQQVGDLYDGGRTVRIGQYSTQSAVPAQNEVEPLEVFVLLHYPKQTVRTVGDAIQHTLTRTGWRLADPFQMQQEAQQFMGLPLPESQRSIGTYRVKDVLQTLAGTPTWSWKYDYVSRVVWFELANPSLSKSAAVAATVGTDNTQNSVADAAKSHAVAAGERIVPVSIGEAQ